MFYLKNVLSSRVSELYDDVIGREIKETSEIEYCFCFFRAFRRQTKKPSVFVFCIRAFHLQSESSIVFVF